MASVPHQTLTMALLTAGVPPEKARERVREEVGELLDHMRHG